MFIYAGSTALLHDKKIKAFLIDAVPAKLSSPAREIYFLDKMTFERIVFAVAPWAVFLLYQVSGIVRIVSPNGTDIDECGTEGFVFCKSVQFAIFQSADGDAVHLVKGRHGCDSGIRFVKADKKRPNNGIIVQGVPGSTFEDVILDCNGQSRAFAFESSAEGNGTQIKGITISNGYAYSGAGAIVRDGASPSFSQCRFYNNTARMEGGGVYVSSGDGQSTNPRFENCIFDENAAHSTDYSGGGAYISAGGTNPSFRNVEFHRNVGYGSGGGILVTRKASPTFINCTFVENKARSPNFSGGGAYISHGSSPSFNDSLFLRNDAMSTGAGVSVFNRGSNPIFIGCNFTENKANHEGGAVYIRAGGEPTFRHSLFLRNDAGFSGGAIFIDGFGTEPQFHHCTCVGNSAGKGRFLDDGGGCAYIKGSRTIFNHCIIGQNSADPYGGGVYIVKKGAEPAFISCIFTGNTAVLGGGGGLIGQSATARFKRTTVSKNTVTGSPNFMLPEDIGGGGIRIINEGTNPSFEMCNFTDNTANRGYGGGIWKDIDNGDSCSTIQGSSVYFFNNTAKVGGGIFIQFSFVDSVCFRRPPSFIIRGNTAIIRSNEIGTTPYKFKMHSFDPSISLNQPVEVKAGIEDYFGIECREILRDYVRIKSNVLTFSSEIYPFTLNGNVSGFNFSVLKAPLKRTYAWVLFESPSRHLVPTNKTVNVRKCARGNEAKNVDQQFFHCVPCPPGSYSLLTGNSCRPCPEIGVNCLGSNLAYTKPGFYVHVGKPNEPRAEQGKISAYPCLPGKCCTNTSGLPLVGGGNRTGFGCLVLHGDDCAEGRDSSSAFCGSCKVGLSELIGSSECQKCEDIGYHWFLLPLPLLLAVVVYLLRKDWKNYSTLSCVLSCMVTENALFFYQAVPLFMPSNGNATTFQVFLSSILNLLNVNYNSFIHDKKGSTELLCVFPGFSGLEEILFGGLYAIVLLLFVLWPICFLIIRNFPKLWKNSGPAFFTCVLFSYMSVTKTLIKLLNCRLVGPDWYLYEAGYIKCFGNVYTTLLQVVAIMLLIGSCLFPYFLFKKIASQRSIFFLENPSVNDISRRRQSFNPSSSRVSWTISVTSPYREDCWWYGPVNLGRRLVILIVNALPLNDHNVTLFVLTCCVIMFASAQRIIKPFHNEDLNLAEARFLQVLILVGLASVTCIPGKDVVIFCLAASPCAYILIFYALEKKRIDSKNHIDENTAEVDKNHRCINRLVLAFGNFAGWNVCGPCCRNRCGHALRERAARVRASTVNPCLLQSDTEMTSSSKNQE